MGIGSRDLRVLQADNAVRKILLVVDSPGGVTTDVAQFARLVATSAKPIVAHVTGMGCSAAYWIISGAREISLDATAMVGSIGVMMGGSVQEAPDQAGRRDVNVVSKSAPNKRPDLTTEDGRAGIQGAVDAIEDVFIAAIAKGRGVDEATVRSDFGQGGTLVGAPAVRARMYGATSYGQQKINFTVAGNLKLPDAGFTAAENTHSLSTDNIGIIAAELIRAGAEDAATKAVHEERIADLAYEEGVVRVTSTLTLCLVEAANGGRTASGEAKAAPVTTTGVAGAA